MAILITGGAGFIGSHTSVCLLEAGYKIVVLDNLSNSKPSAVEHIKAITKQEFPFYITDCCDLQAVRKVFEENAIEAVIHFAGFKAVGESIQKPIEYYSNNLTGVLCILQAMKEFGCKKFVFSSSATVYGTPKTVPIQEDFPLSTINPYGTSKLMTERILEDVANADTSLHIALLRYFNPVGAHESGLLGESPNGIPNNLMPYINQVALGQLPYLSVFGNDYPTHDGTGVRDYIHVMDLARGHVNALEYLKEHPGIETFNLGTGQGYSVLDIVNAFEKACGVQIPYKITKRREGDVAACYADPSKSKKLLHWEAKYDLNQMCIDAWNFTQESAKKTV